MKKKISKCLIFLAIFSVMFFCLGNKGCSSENKILAARAALVTVQVGLQWADQTITKKCLNNEWDDSDCDYYNDVKDDIAEVLNKTVPWVIDKLIETCDEEELAALSERLKK